MFYGIKKEPNLPPTIEPFQPDAATLRQQEHQVIGNKYRQAKYLSKPFQDESTDAISVNK